MVLAPTVPTAPPAPSPPAGRRRRRPPGADLWRASPLTYGTLILAIAISVFPIYWMVVVATRSNDAMGQLPPPLLPGDNLGANLSRLLANTDANFVTGLVNSAIVASCVTFSVVLFSSLAGFAFAKLRFRGRNKLLVLIIATMAVPTQLGVIPLYMLMSRLGWTNQLQAVIVPALVTGFGVFLMRQYAGQAVADELIEAARVDGCHSLRIYWNVVLPALRPAAAVLGLLTFMTTWNDFIWPYAVLNDPENPTVQLSLRALSHGYYQDMSQIFTGTAIATVPLLVVFIVFGRQIIGGIMEGAVKQ
ncbi:carbohydrate ABC transporter permease [Micromonospora zhanjiangensis]|uniref:Carbohydrate ABC transporter permease n=1 Tax=Micromonospora zhanjiangensis TaxID=1522057 RepID=A0ABV8KRE3_9ACTN